MRRQTRKIKVGGVEIGGGAPVSVQSMTKTPASDVKRTAEEIRRLEQAGCELARLAVPDEKSAWAFSEIRKETAIPLIADIHFRHELAVLAARAGADAVRLNPGNIFKEKEIQEVVSACMDKNIPIRVGLNSGSMKTRHAAGNAADAMAEEALEYCERLERFGFKDIIVSLKASSVLMTVAACRSLARRSDYPLHLGVTAAGTFRTGAIKSSVCMGILLAEGTGDTIRVSLTGDPVEEVRTGFEILHSLGLRKKKGPDIISCPACGRCRADLSGIAEEAEKKIYALGLDGKLPGTRIAIMGCEVNGPGEAKEADIGIACGTKSALLFRKGKMLKKVNEKNAVPALMEELINMTGGS